MALQSHEDGIHESYDLFEEGMEETAGKIVRLVKSKKSPNWVSEKTDKLKEKTKTKQNGSIITNILRKPKKGAERRTLN